MKLVHKPVKGAWSATVNDSANAELGQGNHTEGRRGEYVSLTGIAQAIMERLVEYPARGR
jgi:hypothetical protein